MDVKLIVRGGKNEGTVIPINTPSFVIGRSPECTLRLESKAFSRRHAEIIVREGYVGVKDLGSTNGTYVNQERIETEIELKNGNVLKIGPLEVTVQISAELDGKKKPKVASVQEAVNRVASTPKKEDDEDLDLAELFGEDTEVLAEQFQKTLSFTADQLAAQMAAMQTTEKPQNLDSRDAASRTLEEMFKNSLKPQ